MTLKWSLRRMWWIKFYLEVETRIFRRRFYISKIIRKLEEPENEFLYQCVRLVLC